MIGTALNWLIGAGLIVVVYIVANDMYQRRNSRPLSHMKPKPGTVKQFGWMEDQGRNIKTSDHPKADRQDRQDQTNDR